MRRVSIFALLAAAITIAFVAWLYFLNQAPAFPGLVGPETRTLIPEPVPARFEEYGQGSESRLAVVLTDRSSPWLGLVHGLKSIGIPFVVTDDWGRALRHHVVFVYPEFRQSRLEAKTIQMLESFVAQGGTLIGQQIYGARLSALFGTTETVSKHSDTVLSLLPQSFDKEFVGNEERVLSVASRSNNNVGIFAYRNAAETVATFEDGSSSIVRNRLGKGAAYAIGVDLGHLFLKGFNGRQENISPHYVNHYVPVVDVFLRLLKKVYQDGEKNAFVLSTVPQGKDLSVLVTHDVDFSQSLANASAYSSYEKSQGIKATYFIQTKYMRDWNDVGFFDEDAQKIVRALEEDGHEIASHSVCHSGVFNKISLGEGDERYPSYSPFVKTYSECLNCSVLGELRVSKFLLENSCSKPVVSFRPGHLKNPFWLPQALAATGYQFSSSSTANDSLTHLPFRLSYSRETTAQTSLYEFPITVEDELAPPMLQRLDESIALAQKLGRYGGLFVLLIHPNVIEHKMEFEQKFVEAVRHAAWFGTLREFGEFWSARDRVALDVTRKGEAIFVEVLSPTPISGLTLEIPAGLKLKRAEVAIAKQVGQRLVIDTLFGSARFAFSESETALRR